MKPRKVWKWFHGSLGTLAPLVGFGVLLFAAAHSPLETARDGGDPESVSNVSLLPPDPRVSEAKSILLESQYRYYLRLRNTGADTLRRRNAAQSYNLCSAECSPDVFQKTRLPRSVK